MGNEFIMFFIGFAISAIVGAFSIAKEGLFGKDPSTAIIIDCVISFIIGLMCFIEGMSGFGWGFSVWGLVLIIVIITEKQKSNQSVKQDIRKKELEQINQNYEQTQNIGKQKYINAQIIYWQNKVRYWQLMGNTVVRLAPTEQNADLAGLAGAAITGSVLGGAYAYEKTNQANAASQRAYQQSLLSAADSKSQFYKHQIDAESELRNVQLTSNPFNKKKCDTSDTQGKFELLILPQTSTLTISEGKNIRYTANIVLNCNISARTILDGYLKISILDINNNEVAKGYYTPKYEYEPENGAKLSSDTGFGNKKGNTTEIDVICACHSSSVKTTDGLRAVLEPISMWTINCD